MKLSELHSMVYLQVLPTAYCLGRTAKAAPLAGHTAGLRLAPPLQSPPTVAAAKHLYRSRLTALYRSHPAD